MDNHILHAFKRDLATYIFNKKIKTNMYHSHLDYNISLQDPLLIAFGYID